LEGQCDQGVQAVIDPVFNAGSLLAMGESEQRAIGENDVYPLVGQEINSHKSGGVEMAFRGKSRIGLGLGEA
jgi:hypothetical protein